MDIGTVSEDLEVPVASEVVFRKVWRIRNFRKIVSKRDFLDSPEFRCSVNGMSTYWNVSVRFWKGKYICFFAFYNRKITSSKLFVNPCQKPYNFTTKTLF